MIAVLRGSEMTTLLFSFPTSSLGTHSRSSSFFFYSPFVWTKGEQKPPRQLSGSGASLAASGTTCNFSSANWRNRRMFCFSDAMQNEGDSCSILTLEMFGSNKVFKGINTFLLPRNQSTKQDVILNSRTK